MLPKELPLALSRLEQVHTRRHRHTLHTPQGPEVVIDGKPYLAFASNDYLGLAAHPAVVEACHEGLLRWGVGGGASHLVAGHFQIHEEVEEQLARFIGTESALLFSSGYAANSAVIPALVGRGDAIFADKLNHASLNDGCLLSRATFKRFRHNDIEHLKQLLASTPARSRLIAVDAIYSMDGDEAPLRELLALAHEYDAWLYIDDAHGFGVLGQGRGTLAEWALYDERVVYLATFGKAAGVAGACVAATQSVIDWLVNSARTYIFSTSQPPALASALKASLKLIEEESWRREQLFELIQQLRNGLSTVFNSLGASRTPIQPLITGSNEEALRFSSRLKEMGIWVPAIRPPTVPEGSARLRFSLSAAHTQTQLRQLIEGILLVSG